MKCVRCGSELIDHVLTCPNCGFQHDDDQSDSAESPESKSIEQPDTGDKKEKNLASELKSKIKKAFYIDHDDNEAMNLIELYLSMIGIDAEIIEYQEKIKNKRMKNGKPADQKKETPLEDLSPAESGNSSQESLFELEVEHPGRPEDRNEENMTGSTVPEEHSPLESNSRFYELENEEFPGEDIEKEMEFEIDSKDLEELIPQENTPPEDDDQGNEGLLVLEPDEEILELEDEFIEAEKTEKEDFDKPKDLASQFEIEINQENQKLTESLSSDVLSLSEFEGDLIAGPKEDSRTEPENGVPAREEPLNEVPESVESLLDDIKSKKKKAQRLLMIATIVVAFIVLLITLYLLTKKNQPGDKASHPVSIKQKTPPGPAPVEKVEKKREPAASLHEQEYQKHLLQAESHLQKGDLEHAEESIKLAKAIKENPETQKIEYEINQQKIQKSLLSDKEEQQTETLISDEERSYKKVMVSPDISVLEAHLKTYPAGNYSGEIIKRIETLKKKNREMLQMEINQNLQLHRKSHLRSAPQALGPENIQEILKKTRNTTDKIVVKTIAGDQVIINYSTGLMWHIWKESMEFRKAKWWANREYAGYFNWRLPTAEETATLSSSEIPKLVEKPAATIEIWTSDTDRRDSRNIWVFLPLERTFKVFVEGDYKQVCSVRSL